MYPYIVLLHIVGAFLFILAHGASIIVALQLRRERSRERIAALLDLSQVATGGFYVGLVVLLVGGVWAAFAGDHWGRGWTWAALGILVVVMAAMYAMATPFYGRLRFVAGAETNEQRAEAWRQQGVAVAVSDDDAALRGMCESGRPMLLLAIGSIGLLAILWLMVLKPF